MAYPNDNYWKALADGEEIKIRDTPYLLSVADCGELVLPTGLLAVCDPFAMMQVSGNPAIQLPPGRYPVKVTLADVSGLRDGSHIREAYASLILSDEPEETRREMPLLNTTYNAFGVDAGTVCFVDEGALAGGMLPDDWYDSVFDDGTEASWFSRMDNSQEIREGIANVPLPLARNGENLILFHSGWGDGAYGVVGSYDSSGHLTAVHIDFGVVSGPEEDNGEE